MNTLNNISFKNLYNFTCPKTSIAFIVVTNLFLLSCMTCHSVSPLYFLTKFLWFSFILIVAYSKLNTLQNDPNKAQQLTIAPEKDYAKYITGKLRDLTDEKNQFTVFGGLLGLNVLSSWFSGPTLLFFAFNFAFTYRYLKLKGIVKSVNYAQKINSTARDLFSKIPRYQRAI